MAPPPQRPSLVAWLPGLRHPPRTMPGHTSEDPWTQPPASRPGSPRGRAPLEDRPGSTPARVYLSPHLDDAVLSCGGAITAAVAHGEQVLVLTVCAGAPTPEAPLTPFARSVLARIGHPTPAESMQARRSEDEAAARCVGADTFWLDDLDAIYRDATYDTEAALFAAPAPGDRLAESLQEELGALLERWPDAVLYAPLGIGEHIDHQLAHAAAAALAAAGHRVTFYEDFPYVAWDPSALERRLAHLGGRDAFTAEIVPLDEAALERRIAGIACYASQLGLLFGDAQSMARTVTAHAASLASPAGPHGERVWTRRPPTP